jgi:hypothetical protein
MESQNMLIADGALRVPHETPRERRQREERERAQQVEAERAERTELKRKARAAAQSKKSKLQKQTEAGSGVATLSHYLRRTKTRSVATMFGRTVD